MANPDTRLAAVNAAIDAADAHNLNLIDVERGRKPSELVYGRRVSATLERVTPTSSAQLQIAARGQHIERWTSPRRIYPERRAGYLSWRTDFKAFHARGLGDIMPSAG